MSFPQYMPYPIRFPPLNLYRYLSFLGSSPEFFIWDVYWMYQWLFAVDFGLCTSSDILSQHNEHVRHIRYHRLPEHLNPQIILYQRPSPFHCLHEGTVRVWPFKAQLLSVQCGLIFRNNFSTNNTESIEATRSRFDPGNRLPWDVTVSFKTLRNSYKAVHRQVSVHLQVWRDRVTEWLSAGQRSNLSL